MGNWQCIISGVQNNFKEQIFSFIYYLKTKNYRHTDKGRYLLNFSVQNSNFYHLKIGIH
jgi:hypothetical protein